MRLFELANKPYQFKFVGQERDQTEYMFVTDSKRQYFVNFTEFQDMAIVTFEDAAHGVDLTNDGDAFRIFSTVAAVVKQFVTTRPDIQELVFSAAKDSPSRIKLYDRFAKSLPKYIPRFEFKEAGTDPTNTSYFVYVFKRINTN